MLYSKRRWQRGIRYWVPRSIKRSLDSSFSRCSLPQILDFREVAFGDFKGLGDKVSVLFLKIMCHVYPWVCAGGQAITFSYYHTFILLTFRAEGGDMRQFQEIPYGIAPGKGVDPVNV